ncbi:hypothetical protein ZIOFF_009136 [Zingiber officinale]|uniref:Uncharacterized protein n=1 Tax=Zingiber officinale TaxID=94328 RepID=A0A8J5HMK4_ZINOF|nr:hypothetical protein ZIOFF_009136 [Zingiber officinale]
MVQDFGHASGMSTNIGHGAKVTVCGVRPGPSTWVRANVWCVAKAVKLSIGFDDRIGNFDDLGEGLFHDPSASLRCGSSLLCGLKDGYGFRSVSCGCSTDLVRSVLAAEEALQARKQICRSNCKGVDASWGSEQDGWAGFLMIDWEVLSIELEAHGKDLEFISPCILVESILGLDLLVPEAYNFSSSEDSFKFIKRLQVFVIATLTIFLPDDFENHFKLLIKHPILSFYVRE